MWLYWVNFWRELWQLIKIAFLCGITLCFVWEIFPINCSIFCIFYLEIPVLVGSFLSVSALFHRLCYKISLISTLHFSFSLMWHNPSLFRLLLLIEVIPLLSLLSSKMILISWSIQKLLPKVNITLRSMQLSWASPLFRS